MVVDLKLVEMPIKPPPMSPPKPERHKAVSVEGSVKGAQVFTRLLIPLMLKC